MNRARSLILSGFLFQAYGNIARRHLRLTCIIGRSDFTAGAGRLGGAQQLGQQHSDRDDHLSAKQVVGGTSVAPERLL